jgi:hypothetical protein
VLKESIKDEKERKSLKKFQSPKCEKNFLSPKKFQSVENWLCSAKMLKKFFVGRMLKIFLSPDRKILEISFVVHKNVENFSKSRSQDPRN